MSRYTLEIEGRFEAAHHLTSYRGKPEVVHGHSWRVHLILEAEELDAEGMAFDFVQARAALDQLTARLHHRHLNEVSPFDLLSPTTEHVARWFFEQLSSNLPKAGVAAVKVWEGPDCSATYRPS